MSLPPFPSLMFPNEITVYLCEDSVNARGGAKPVQDAGTDFFASVQDKGTYWDSNRQASVTRYKVSFNVDPSNYLTRPIRSGDSIAWGALVLSASGPATNRGGYAFLWRVECEHVKQ